MCGFAGFFQQSQHSSVEQMEAIAAAMADRLAHRGPDDSGVWADPKAGVAFGFRRLAVVDLSPHGHQPMRSFTGRYVIAFNGEIYNHRRLRCDLESCSVAFRGHSDTEVLLAAIEQWGLEQALTRSVGMFALALWDSRERRLYLSRDRIGERPLYYGLMGNVVLFGSELKALKAHPAWCGEIDRDVVTLLLRYGYIPAPFSIFKGIWKLPPASILTVNDPANLDLPNEYWSARSVVESGAMNQFGGDEVEATNRLEALLQQAIRDQMVADVPVGALLSGGIDSSTVVALMQAASSRPAKTFTIGFHESAFNEAQSAAKVAKHLGTDHSELYVSSADGLAVIPKLPALYDEPFADHSQIPTYLVTSLARQNVTVSLSGDGGDELFGGYQRYSYSRRIWDRLGCVPRPVRTAASRLIRAGASASRQRRRLELFADLIEASSPAELYLRFLSNWQQPGQVVLRATEPRSALTDNHRPSLHHYLEMMMYLDLVSFLPDDILVKVDRASMGVSLELRAPFLDHRVVEFAATLPLAMKIGRGQTKRILRNVLHKYVPTHLVDRPKWGFVLPLAEWLRGPLRPWAESLLDETRLRSEGIFEPLPIVQRWREHRSGRADWVSSLWSVLMFQAWAEENSHKG
jgi:asparagine synthase (glutamine-hydrolysing)